MDRISWDSLREVVEQNGRTVSPRVFDLARRLFLTVQADNLNAAFLDPAALTREWASDEFLQVAGENGAPALASPEIMDAYKETAAGNPGFSRWFRPALLPGGEFQGQPVLLANRWLCHLAGLRHLTVEIFIDPPGLPGFTLVQVRGMEKVEAPGCFDIPCAGHIDGLAGVEESLVKELAEELNLGLEDLEGLCMVGEYESVSGSREGPRNNEYRYLYRAGLRPSCLSKIAFADGEVAALCVFGLDELRGLVRRFPERVASGLKDAMGYYR